MTAFQRPDGLYKTWLAPQNEYRCLDPGDDPNPADVGIQTNIFLFLEKADKEAARALCTALSNKAGDDDIWVYYAKAPLMVMLRLVDMEKADCRPQFPPARLRTDIPGQEIWIKAADLLRQARGRPGSTDVYQHTAAVLKDIAANDFSLIGETPPLLYHNDLTGSVRRFYWSQDFGYALWLRLYVENELMRSTLSCDAGGQQPECGDK